MKQDIFFKKVIDDFKYLVNNIQVSDYKNNGIHFNITNCGNITINVNLIYYKDVYEMEDRDQKLKELGL